MQILSRANFSCEYCGKYDTTANGMWSVHHRKPRGMGGSKSSEANSPMNLLLLCGSGVTGCHGYFESNRTEGYEKKVLLRQSDEMSPYFTDKKGVEWMLDENYGKVRLGFQPQFR
jgi:hypothetical protein